MGQALMNSHRSSKSRSIAPLMIQAFYGQGPARETGARTDSLSRRNGLPRMHAEGERLKHSLITLLRPWIP